MPKQEKGLGRGLDALFAESNQGEADVNQIEIGLIKARDDQPRQKFEQESIRELAASIQQHGILQPLLVRPSKQGYEIIAGERRFRAAQMSGLELLPVIVREMDDVEAAEISLIENLQREDLSPVEEARAYRNMIDSFGYTQELLAQKIGKSRTHIANTMRLLNLPEKILKLLEDGRISSGHARAILSLDNPEKQLIITAEILEKGLSVREVEEKVRQGRIKKKTNRTIEAIDMSEYIEPQRAAVKPPEIVALEERIQERLGTKVEICNNSKGGKISITFFSDEDLERIIEIMGV